MLENWCFEKAVLERISKHVKTGQPLPESLREQLVRARSACSGMLSTRQLFFAYSDMELSTAKGQVDSGESYRRLRPKCSGIEGTLMNFITIVKPNQNIFV